MISKQQAAELTKAEAEAILCLIHQARTDRDFSLQPIAAALGTSRGVAWGLIENAGHKINLSCGGAK